MLTDTTLLQSNRPSTSIQEKEAMKKRWSSAVTIKHATCGIKTNKNKDGLWARLQCLIYEKLFSWELYALIEDISSFNDDLKEVSNMWIVVSLGSNKMLLEEMSNSHQNYFYIQDGYCNVHWLKELCSREEYQHLLKTSTGKHKLVVFYFHNSKILAIWVPSAQGVDWVFKFPRSQFDWTSLSKSKSTEAPLCNP